MRFFSPSTHKRRDRVTIAEELSEMDRQDSYARKARCRDSWQTWRRAGI